MIATLILYFSLAHSFYFMKIDGIAQTFNGQGDPIFHESDGVFWSFDISCYSKSTFADGFESKPPFTLKDGLSHQYGLSNIEVIGITYYLTPAKMNDLYCFQGIVIQN